MITKNRITFISVMIILIIITSLYATYALNISIEENDATDYDKSLTFDIYDDTIRQISVAQGKTKSFNLNIKNPYADSIQYGIAYSMVSPTTLPEGVIVAQSSKSKASTVGLIETNDTISVSIIVVNESTEDITLSFAIINGFKNGGELIVSDGQTLVTDIYEVGTPLADITLEKLGLTEEVLDITPDFSKKAPQTLSYKIYDETLEFGYTVTDTSYYMTYASSYTFDTTTGTFTLVSPSISTYSSIYSSLVGKYVTGSPSASSTMATTSERESVYLVMSANSSGLVVQRITNSSDSLDTSECGIFASEDDFGTSYYFRGNVENNYVKFADFYWRIVRINGDGTLRIIFDGARAHKNGIFYENDRSIDIVNYNVDNSDNAYVGYMYGTTGSDTYAETHANINDGLPKQAIDRWYKNNIVLSGNSKYVADAIYCNDRTMYSGTGIKEERTTYMTYRRVNTYSPTLKCAQVNDRFTVSSETGNGDLTYPVGLITADEVSMAGALYFSDYLNDKPNYNKDFYLRHGGHMTTMSPGLYTTTSGYLVLSYNGGLISFHTTSDAYLRPVISLRQDLTYTGTGTMTDPFIPVLN